MTERLRIEPLRGSALAAAVFTVWIGGALYCSGYEALASGLDNWPSSLWWSAIAVLPWLALFEWSKTETGRRATRPPARLGMALAATASVSLGLEVGADALLGSQTVSPALSLLRRLPAVGVCLLLILWSRAGQTADDEAQDENLLSIAASIDWVSAADNYVELHVGERKLMRRMTMRHAERILAPRGFVRIHRRYLVNRARIENLRGKGDERVIRLADGGELPVGRAYAGNLDR